MTSALSALPPSPASAGYYPPIPQALETVRARASPTLRVQPRISGFVLANENFLLMLASIGTAPGTGPKPGAKRNCHYRFVFQWFR
jgi:hypothetical protein